MTLTLYISFVSILKSDTSKEVKPMDPFRFGKTNKRGNKLTYFNAVIIFNLFILHKEFITLRLY